MFASVHRTRGLRLIRAAAGAVRVSGWTIDRTDPDGLRHVATMLVRIHWFFAATCLVQLVCRPAWGAATYAAYALLFLALVAFTGCPHYRLASGRLITWRWIFAQSAVDTAVVSGPPRWAAVSATTASTCCTTRCWPASRCSSPRPGSTWPVSRRWPSPTRD